MKNFEFNALINVQADSYEQAVEMFNSQLKYGFNNDSHNVSVIEIVEI